MRRFLVLLVTLAVPASADTVLQAWAYINLADVPPRQVSSDGTPVSSSASTAESSASAHASASSIGARASSSDGFLVEGAHAIASARTTFRVTSRSGGNEPVPLTFNVAVTGSISANSSPNILGAGPDVSVASVSIRSNVDTTERNGGILLGSQKGILKLELVSGAFREGGPAHGPTDWSVDIRLARAVPPVIPWNLLPPYLRVAGIAATLYDALSTASQVVQALEGKAKIEGFPELGFPPGWVMPVAMVTIGIDNTFPLTRSIRPDGRPHFMGLSIISQASSAPTAQSTSDYSNTVGLESITVDAAWPGDPADLTVTFDDGRTFPVTRQRPPRRRAVRHP